MLRQHYGPRLRSLLLIMVAMASILAMAVIPIQPAYASIREIQESSSQVVYQSRQKLFDRNNVPWQAIAFKRITAEGDTMVRLRLVGFPGSVELFHAHPLTITLPSGTTFTAADVSEELFTSGEPAGNVGQYDIGSVIAQLPETLTVEVSVPTVDETTVKLAVSPLTIQEWKQLAAQHP